MSEDASRTDPTRFHVLRADGLYEPIPFFLVTDRMAREILDERSRLLALAGAKSDKQARLFARYDPQVSAHAFDAWLQLFQLPGETEAGATATANEVAAPAAPRVSRRRRTPAGDSQP